MVGIEEKIGTFFNKNVAYETCASFAEYPLIMGVTRRNEGVSKGAFSSLNMGLHVGDDVGAVIKNREILAQSQGVQLEDMVFAEQVHELKSLRIDASMKGSGVRDYQTALPRCDAMYTNEKNIMLVICIADCFPVCIYDPVQHAVATIHAGWRGVIGELPRTTLISMEHDFGTMAKDCLAYIGPGIQQASFEVSEDVAHRFVTAFGEHICTYLKKDNSKESERKATPHIWLGEAIRQSLIAQGMNSSKIYVSSTDSFTNKDCYSYRREHGRTGRMALFAMLK